MNQFKKTATHSSSSQAKESLSKLSSPFKNLLTGDFIKKDALVNALPFLFFMTFLGLCYIANGYYAEKTIRELYNANRDLKELRSEYITIKSELEIVKQQSQIAIIISGMGLEESRTPPKKIVIHNQHD
jgi:hypothetical protein